MKTLLIVALVLAAPAALAQSVPDWAAPMGSSEGPSGSPSDPAALLAPPTLPGGGVAPLQEVPIDGGLGLLALAGGAYAVRRLRQRA